MIIKRNDLIFAVRTTAASLIALYIAFLMNMDDPKWAAMTVWIVAQSSRAMSVSKSIYRLMGTAIGVVVAVLLTAIFIQTPTLFLLVLASWIGLCTALSTGLRNFRSYGAVLAGYTAAIVAIDSLSDPDNVFEIAVSRLIYIALGIVTEASSPGFSAPTIPLKKRARSLESSCGRRQNSALKCSAEKPEPARSKLPIATP